MKKTLTIVTLASAMLLAGCSSNNSSGSSQSSASATSSQDKTNGASFKNNVLEDSKVKIEITKTQVSQPGEEGNDTGDKPAFVIWYKVTNKSVENLTANAAWFDYFTLYQDNNPNKETKLSSTSMAISSEFAKTMRDNIKVGGTVDYGVAYTLEDTTTPVKVVAQPFLSDKIGEQTFEIK